MANNCIWCNINLFDLHQKIVFPDGTTQVVDLVDLPQALVSYCHDTNIYTVCLSGDDVYIDFIKKDVAWKEKETYNLNQITWLEGEQK